MLSNKEIQNIYLENISNEITKWDEDLFHAVSRRPINRLKKNKNKFERDELSQIIRMKIWLGIKAFDPHKNFDFYRWIKWHVRSSFRDFRRANHSFYSINLSDDNTSNIQEFDYSRFVVKELFERADLSEQEREILLKYYIEGFTLSEIALECKVSAEAIRKKCEKIIMKMKMEI